MWVFFISHVLKPLHYRLLKNGRNVDKLLGIEFCCVGYCVGNQGAADQYKEP